MASRSLTTFKKRQKELARMEKQRDKAAKRMQRKTMKQSGIDTLDPETGEPQELGVEETPDTPDTPDTEATTG
jgi:DNA repair ATPase RecN